MTEGGAEASAGGYRRRDYRMLGGSEGFSFTLTVAESDLWIVADRPGLEEVALDILLSQRRPLEGFVAACPEWGESLVPVEESAYPLAPLLARQMMTAAARVGVGPLAAVAGALAEAVGRELWRRAEWVAVENGGDLFLAGRSRWRLALYAGNSPFSGTLGIELEISDGAACGVCTSSARVGHSLSLGRADAVTVVAENALLADAAATAAANRVQTRKDLARVVDDFLCRPGIWGVVAIQGDALAAGGDLKLIEISGPQ